MGENATELTTPRSTKTGVIGHSPRQRLATEAGIWRDHPTAKTPIHSVVSNTSVVSQRVDDVERARRFDQEDLDNDHAQVLSPSSLKEIYYGSLLGNKSTTMEAFYSGFHSKA